MKYNRISKLQGSVGLDAPNDVIFEAASNLTPSAQKAACTALELLRMLYNEDGSINLSVREAARKLKTTRQAVNQRRVAIIRRVRHVLCE